MTDDMTQGNGLDGLPELQGLAVKAPAGAFSRFRRRAGLMQGGKLLIDSQVTGFWIVLDALLTRFFRAVPFEQNVAQPGVGGEEA
jgi:hypothetical protein